MPVLRIGQGNYKITKEKPAQLQQRQEDDFDLGWGTVRVYVLAEHEWFDPHTSSKEDSHGVSRHAMRGPAVVVQQKFNTGYETIEFDVNDPRVWEFVREAIQEERLTKGKVLLAPVREA